MGLTITTPITLVGEGHTGVLVLPHPALSALFRCRLVSFEEFAAFESLLWHPNADSLLAFRLFDQERKGSISFSELFWPCTGDTP